MITFYFLQLYIFLFFVYSVVGTMLGNIMSGDPSSIQSPSNLNEQLNFLIQI